MPPLPHLAILAPLLTPIFLQTNDVSTKYLTFLSSICANSFANVDTDLCTCIMNEITKKQFERLQNCLHVILGKKSHTTCKATDNSSIFQFVLSTRCLGALWVKK